MPDDEESQSIVVSGVEMTAYGSQAVSRVLSDGDEDCERVGVDGCDGIRRMMRRQQQQLLLWEEMERQSREEVESIKTKFLAIAAVTWLIWLLFYMPLSQLDLL